ncbi:MAG: PRC and DUF2382 domain-containing protein [Actinomycetota bacterium]|nr:PRC and DUF2382 domain-containing protein [Actinomycetota bacterium]
MTSSVDMQALQNAQGNPVYSNDGEQIGKVEEVFHDIDTDQPEWIGIGTGFFSNKRVLVPVASAEMREDGVYVPYSKDHVSGAPSIDGDEISQETEAELYSFYDIEYGENRSDSGLPEGTQTESTETRTDTDTTRTPDTTDSSEKITRSEEELHAGTRQREAGQVRVRKYVDTEKAQTTVPTSREEISVERVPVSEGTSTEAEFSEGEITVPIVEEEAVVEKRPVVKEELRISKETVTGEETVEADVRKERIDLDEEGSTTSSTETTR